MNPAVLRVVFYEDLYEHLGHRLGKVVSTTGSQVGGSAMLPDRVKRAN